jgi:hypothetical protein
MPKAGEAISPAGTPGRYEVCVKIRPPVHSRPFASGSPSSAGVGKIMIRASTVVLWCLVVVFGAVRPAHAYLDANTGSLLVQLLVGGIAGLALVGKLFWHRLKGFFGFSQTEPEEDRPPQ